MITSGDKAMKRYLRWIVAAEFLFAAGNLHAVEVEGVVVAVVLAAEPRAGHSSSS